MCRNIKPLNNFEPPATDEEIHQAALQFVRKISGTVRPSAGNQVNFDQAVEDISLISARLIRGLTTQAPARNREVERAKARARNTVRFGR